MAVLYTNNALSTLASSITNVATSLSVATSAGALFPSISGGNYFYATLADTSGNIEIIKVTARTTDTFTIVRGQDGTTARAWNAGDKVELRITKAMLDDFKTDVKASLVSSDITTALGFTPYNSTNPSGYITSSALTSYAPLASPTFTGTPAAPTAAVDTNTTQLATTAYVVGQGYLKSATASSTYLPLAGGTLTGNLAFSGAGLRITGDFTNATVASRALFQTSTANGQTYVTAIPNGTAVNAQFQAYNSSDPTNASVASLAAANTTVRLVSGNVGTGTLLPLVIVMSATEIARFATNGNFLIGTTSDNAADKLQVSGSAYASGGFKRRVVTIADATSITINADTTDLATQANTQAAGTLTINAPTGTPVNGQQLLLRLTCTNAQTFSWNAIFRGSTDQALPTASSGAGKEDYLGFIYNSTDTKWDLIAKNFGF